MHSKTSHTRGILSRLRRAFLAVAVFGVPAISAAQNADFIGLQIKAQSSAIPSTQNSTNWSPKISDPIGDLISQAKADRANRDASIGLKSGNAINNELAQAALNYVGVRYRFGGASPTGFDCSGLIYYTASKYMGVELPRVASSMANVGTSVQRTELQPGDLVFFNTRGFRNSHVGIYLGNNEFLHAPRTGTTVRVEKMSNYWSKRYNGARRLEGQRLASAK